jgi:phenylacetate-CoA ligase
MADPTTAPGASVLAALAELAQRGNPRDVQTFLAKTEKWSQPERVGHQLARMTELLRHARETVPYYASRLPPVSSGVVGLEEWRTLPLLQREDIQDHHAELASSSPLPHHRVIRESSTSGSTGRPVGVRMDGPSTAMDAALALRHHFWHGRDLTEKSAVIRGFKDAHAPNGRREPRWTAYPRSGPLVLLDVRSTLDEQLDWLVRERPHYLATSPTNASSLLGRAEERGIVVDTLREILTLGEVLPDSLRAEAHRVWGIPVSDAYSTVELGFVGFDCAKRSGLHVQAEHVFVEVLREDGSPCEVGEWGRIVVTALHAFAMPFIRYDIGDYALVGEACPCGRTLPILARILGRVRNMLRLPNGGHTWPVFGGNTFGKLAPVRQFRLVQRSLERLELELVTARALSVEEEGLLRSEVLRVIRHPFELGIRYVDAIARSANGKFEEFRCEMTDEV